MQADLIVVVKPWIGMAITVIGAFTLGGVWVNFTYMRKHMVTKQDLKITMLEADKKYVTKEECAAMRVKPNGGVRGHGAAGGTFE